MRNTRIGFFFLLLISLAACKHRAIDNGSSTKGMDVEKAIAKNEASNLHFNILSLKGKADFEDLEKGTKIGLSYRIDIAKDSLILINISKFGIPAMNMLVEQDTVRMRIPINQTATICDFELLRKMANMDLDFAKLQSILLGEAVLEKPINLTSTKGSSLELQASRPPYLVSWILNSANFKLEKMRMEDLTLGKKSEISYSEFKKIEGQTIASTVVVEATQTQSVRIELHHSGIEFDKEKVNFRFRIPESYTINPCEQPQPR